MIEFLRTFIERFFQMSNPSVNLQFIGDRIKILREKKNLTQAELAHKANIAQSTLSYIESGQKSPTIYTVAALAFGLDISVSEILDGYKFVSSTLKSPDTDKIPALSRLSPEDFSKLMSELTPMLYKNLVNESDFKTQTISKNSSNVQHKNKEKDNK